MTRLVSIVIISFLTGVSVAEQGVPLSKQQETLRRKAHSLNVDAPISVIPIHAMEEFGKYVGSDDEEITFYVGVLGGVIAAAATAK